MIKVFFIGDFYSNNGPSIANNALFKCLLSDRTLQVSRSDNRNKLYRLFELLIKLPTAHVICLCSFSFINYFAILSAKLFHKKIMYILHGYIQYEEEINGTPQKLLKKMTRLENFTFRYSDKIICVSKKAMEFVQNDFKEHCNKYEYIYNYVDIKEKNHIPHESDLDYIFMSIGGGMPRKSNLQVCKAIELLIDRGFLKRERIRYIVIGPLMQFGNEIKSYDFVEYYEQLNHDQVIKKMQIADLYIQNSIFDTFCLAVVEAIKCGCNVLMSVNVGAIDFISGLTEDNIIVDVSDVSEIAKKIKNNIMHLSSYISLNAIDSKDIADKFKSIVKSLN